MAKPTPSKKPRGRPPGSRSRTFVSKSSDASPEDVVFRRNFDKTRAPLTNSAIGDWLRCIAPAIANASTPREQLVAQNLRLVPFIAMKARRGPQNVSDDDLQIATISLIRCADGFDPSLGIKFSTYACKAIYFSLIRKKRHPDPISLDAIGEGGGDDFYSSSVSELSTIDALIVDQPPDAGMESAERLSLTAEILAGFDERTAGILSLYYMHDFTLCQVGDIYGVTKERVRQIILKAVARIRRHYKPGLQGANDGKETSDARWQTGGQWQRPNRSSRSTSRRRGRGNTGRTTSTVGSR